ncbi:sucrase ferredoxin [Rhodococcus sovatensis]|uniref:Sucrase ferredoxin n=1 Tax=Rhodococcus sovatensis TaxID=1805840 RepID=A0ABZ2PHM5_9NOCA
MTGIRAPGCAAISRASGESLRGTAAVAAGWLLVEHPGPWGAAPYLSDGPLGEVGVELQRRCAPLRVRLQLIRDPHRPRTDTSERRAFLVHSGRIGPWITRHHYRYPNELLDLDIASAVADTLPESGEPVLQPLYLVCTHGKKDPCCAVFGRPIVRALADSRSQVFESTHVGGDRFAGGMVALPDGSYYGHLEPSTAEEIIERHGAGHLTLNHYRGRCTDTPAVQVAEHGVRTLRTLTGIGDVLPRGTTSADQDTAVVFETPGAAVTVHVTPAPQSARKTTCNAAEPHSADHGKITSIHISSLD